MNRIIMMSDHTDSCCIHRSGANGRCNCGLSQKIAAENENLGAALDKMEALISQDKRVKGLRDWLIEQTCQVGKYDDMTPEAQARYDMIARALIESGALDRIKHLHQIDAHNAAIEKITGGKA